jgi:hypothetical protein
MKTGIIVYIASNDLPDNTVDHQTAVNKLNIEADRLEFVSATSGHFDISDAWWSLTVKGMQRIICKLAEFTSLGDLKLTGRELRLYG